MSDNDNKKEELITEFLRNSLSKEDALEFEHLLQKKLCLVGYSR